MNWNDRREKYDEIGAARVRDYVERLARKRAARDDAAEPAPLAGPGPRPEIHHPSWWLKRYTRHGGRVQPPRKVRPPW
jgi:hypothetical protein